jgi:hypothetical protein
MRRHISTIEEMDGLDIDENIDGYLSGFRGEARCGNNRSSSYWHGWKCGLSDFHKNRQYPDEIKEIMACHHNSLYEYYKKVAEKMDVS